MRPAAKFTASIAILLAISMQAQTNTPEAMRTAEDEAVRRQEATLKLHFTLDQARTALKDGQVNKAAQLYEDAVAHLPEVQVGDPKVDEEKAEALAGLDWTHERLARLALQRGDLVEAGNQVNSALKFDTTNEVLRTLRIQINEAAVNQRGTVPSAEVLKSIPDLQNSKIEVATLVQDGKFLYEAGMYDEAEAKLKEALKRDPSNTAAPYYLDLLKEARYMNAARIRESNTKTELVEVERSWLLPNKQEGLPVPNSFATTNTTHLSPGHSLMMRKLQNITLTELDFGPDGLPLSEVIRRLHDESKKRDIDQQGINFLYNPHAGGAGGAAPDATGAAPPAVDPNSINIKITGTLNDVTMLEALDAITKLADQPIAYTVEDYAVWFWVKQPDTGGVPLYTRFYHIDPNTFIQGLQGVTLSGISGSANTTGGSGGGGGVGGGGFGGGGGGFGGGGGGFGGGGGGFGGGGGGFGGGGGGFGGGGGGGGQGSVTFPTVTVVGGGAAGGRGGAAGGTTGTGGLQFVTTPANTGTNSALAKAYFTAAGVDFAAGDGKFVFWNDRSGDLMVRATAADLDIIGQALDLLNKIPPQLTIDTKFASVTEEDTKGVGFNWIVGNSTINNGAIGIQPGTAPSYQGPSTAGNPSGIFPGPGPAGSNPGQIAPSASDNVLTAGLRNTVGANQTPITTLATITGIMTDPQFRLVINAIEQRSGSDLLSAPRVTTESGRQAKVAVQDLISIVTSVTLGSTAAGGIGGTTTTGGAVGGGAAVAASSSYSSTPFAAGPELDVLPTISADGYSIQMVLIPTYTEFVGYDNPGQFIPQSQSVAGSSIGVPLTAQLPLPHYRVRQAVTSVNVWDGQTIMLGGMIAESITKLKDKVPVLGDLPIVGRLFQSQSSDSQKQNLMIFVTPTIIDPAGNKVHTDDNMPYAAKAGIPPTQTPPPMMAPMNQKP